MFLAVAAAVIGGTPLAGGSGTIIGGLIGAAVLGILNDGFTLIGINAFTFNMILGAAILGGDDLQHPCGPSRAQGRALMSDAVPAEARCAAKISSSVSARSPRSTACR